MKLGRHRWLPAAIAVVLPLFLATYGRAGFEGIIFSHSLHVEDAEIGCTECHPKAEHAGGEVQTLLPAKGNCAQCHDVEDQSNCTMCHASADVPPRCVTVLACKAFSHEKHLRDRTTCSACHEGIECTESSLQTFRPKKTICSDCHRKDRIQPTNHGAGWQHLHGRDAEREPQSCGLCHVEGDDCETCHRGDNLTGASAHPPSYIYSHGPEARLDEIRCQSCHRSQEHCTTCHIAYGVRPLSHDASGWRSGGHAPEGRRHLEQCMNCHTESEAEEVCGGCHR